MEISVNGEPRTVPDNCTLLQLLEQLKLEPKYVAVERNFELVPRRNHRDCQLNPGDSIEIVTLVGGG